MKWRITIALFASLYSYHICNCQVSPASLQKFINTQQAFSSLSLAYPEEVKEFYYATLYTPVWCADEPLLSDLLFFLQQSRSSGLDPAHYQSLLARQVQKEGFRFPRLADTLAAECQLTDALIHFSHDLMFGSHSPDFGYKGISQQAYCRDLLAILQLAVGQRRVRDLGSMVEPSSVSYLAMKEEMARIQNMISDTSFREVAVVSSKVTVSNKPLLNRLKQLGYITGNDVKLSDSLVKVKVKEAQRKFDLLSDGVLRSTTLQAINVPLSQRLEELEKAMNTFRWMSCLQQSGKVIVVNIPSASLIVFEGDKMVLQSRIIVGKPSTPTPRLSSKVTEIILYPYWMVPHSIAVKEILPAVKRNRSYLDAGNYDVINQQGRRVDPSTINWQSLGASNFPYIIRQSTGCDNALGLIKLNFYNPFSVYLHDTPNKNLFSLNRRYFSHGCMRVEKAMELGRMLLGENTAVIDTLTEKGCLYHQSPVTVPVAEPIPVLVLYQTAWFNADGLFGYFEDVYKRRGGK